MKDKVNIFWFRRDLRLTDNTGLSVALSKNIPVLPVFIFDTGILSRLSSSYDRRVDYIQQALEFLNKTLIANGSSFKIFHENPISAFEKLIKQYDIQEVFLNRDYEPEAIKRDAAIEALLKTHGIKFNSFKDQVIFDRDEVVKPDGKAYTVFTPYARSWKLKLNDTSIKEKKIDLNNFYKNNKGEIPSIEKTGFQKTDIKFYLPEIDIELIEQYDMYRDYPAMNNTSRLGMALRFGTISIRKCVKAAVKYNSVWLNELIWREFFMQILFHFPQVEHHCFKPLYENLKWRNNEKEFELWCRGKTGYPIVDAGMRELNATGFMHNRVRMITAGFLTKHLLTDWRWGEAYFASRLNDYELSSNNGNWQWVAGCGCDAAPYFRIFNPFTQTEKFDKDHIYIRKWISLKEENTTPPIVDHQFARERAIKAYKTLK